MVVLIALKVAGAESYGISWSLQPSNIACALLLRYAVVLSFTDQVRS